MAIPEEIHMSDKTYKVLPSAKKRALIDNETYLKWYADSLKSPDKFWGKHGKRIDWFKPYTKVKNTSFTGKVAIKWYEDGLTNVSYNCIDRHLKKRGDQIAIIWEGDNPYDDKKITYKELSLHVNKLANVMKSNGVKKGDRVTIYMPIRSQAALLTATPPSSSRRTRACAAARRCLSKTTPTKPSTSPPRLA
jgi:acetyl-CoA synthetase